MFRSLNVRNLCTKNSGSVTVEFAFALLFLLVFMFFMVDLVVKQALVGKLDRVSYSVAGVLRERTQLYHSCELLNQNDVQEALELSRRMLKDMNSSADLSQMGIQVEELHFVQPYDLKYDTMTIKYNHSFSAGNVAGCAPPQTLASLKGLSPKGSYGRWVPLYQVTVCLPAADFFSRFINTDSASSVMSSFAVVMVR
ncbi:flp pilus assembly surface protein TadF [Salmonella enterica]|nr:flp pilus assembly surface protein TadF [Salmonella enterica]